MGLLLSAGFVASNAAPAADDEMVENPKYKFWANFKPGATATYTEVTKLGGPEKGGAPGGVEHKTITYRLQSVSKDKVVVLTTVVEEDFLSTIESAPTRITFPAKVKKANLVAFLNEWHAMDGKDEMIKIGDKEIKCHVKAGTQKIEGGSVEAKFCFSDAVPGGVVKHTRITRGGETVVAETVTTLVSFSETPKE
jgi:hypothetical protein